MSDDVLRRLSGEVTAHTAAAAEERMHEQIAAFLGPRGHVERLVVDASPEAVTGDGTVLSWRVSYEATWRLDAPDV